MNHLSTGARLFGALLVSLTLLLPASRAQAEGFAIMENSARGMALAGGLIARGGDPSTLAYNPAAMTLLDGTQMQANLAVSQFYWGVDTRTPSGQDTGNYHSAHQTWPIPSFYVTHQINDNVWFGLASYTRFGLGVKHPNEWQGGATLQFAAGVGLGEHAAACSSSPTHSIPASPTSSTIISPSPWAWK